MPLVKSHSQQVAEMLEYIDQEDNKNIVSFMDSIKTSIIFVDPRSKVIVFANRHARSEFSDLRGKPCWTALGYEKPCCPKEENLHKNILQMQKSEQVWREHRTFKINLNDRNLVMCTIQDISKEMMKEKDGREKVNLISMASHELKTPLTIITSTLQLLEKFDKDWRSPNTLKHTRRIQKATEQINKLLDNLLLVEKAKTQKVKFNPQLIDLVNLGRTIIDNFQECMEPDHNIILHCEQESIYARADEFILTTILNNLLSNASKYSKKKNQIRLNLGLSDDSIVLRVEDDGIGIPEAEQGALFQAFYRTSNVGRVPGMGLGLSIVKDFVDLHGGTIEFVSRENVGTTFVIKIPYCQ